MATLFSHALVGGMIGFAVAEPKLRPRAAAWGAVFACVPDLDVIGFMQGVQYGDPWGHRGLTHSLIFAAVLALAFSWIIGGSKWRAWALLFLATASHGVLDAFTSGGLGVAFFAPFDLTRYFFPWRPVLVSPIGAGFFSARGTEVMKSEIMWIWLPCITFWFILAGILRKPAK